MLLNKNVIIVIALDGTYKTAKAYIESYQDGNSSLIQVTILITSLTAILLYIIAVEIINIKIMIS